MADEAPNSQQGTTERSTAEWQRLSPIAIIYFSFSSIKALISNFIYILPGLAVSYATVKQSSHIWLPAIGVGLLAIVLYGVLSFYFYRYRLSDNTVEIRSGVFQKKHLNLPFNKIQNVQLEQPVFYRVTGYTCMQLDTAGSVKQEAKVVALPMEFAQQLKKQILSQRSVQKTASESTPEVVTVGDEQVLNRRSISDLVVHGITNNQIWIFLGALAPFYDDIGVAVSDWLESVGINFAELFSLQTQAWWQITLYAISLTMLFMLLIATLSVLGSILIYYGFTLSKTNDRYIKRSGLLTRQEVSMRLSRLQLVVRKQDWLDVLLKRINLRMEQNNAGFEGPESLGNTNKILVPSITPDECKQLVDDAFENNQLSSVEFTSIDKRFMVRNLLIFLALPVILTVLAIVFEQAKFVAFTLPACALVTLVVLLRWYRWGYAWDDQYVYIRKGLLGVDYYCFPIYKLQQSKFIQSFLMKRNKLASCTLVLASGGLTIPFMQERDAHTLINACLYVVESQKRSWM